MTSTSDYFAKTNPQCQDSALNGRRHSLDQDLHLKMSKKIAQLTKVIYALNTKNDDHEAMMGVMRSQHANEIRQITEEMSAKIDLLDKQMRTHSKNGEQVEEMLRINKSYERKLEEAQTKLKKYKNENIQIIKDKDVKHADELDHLGDQIKSLRASYEQLLDDYYKLDKTMESEKNSQIKHLKLEYENEIKKITEESDRKEQQLKNLISGNQNETQMLLAKAQEEIHHNTIITSQLTQDYEKRIQDLQTKMDSMSSEFYEKKKFFELEIEEQKSKQSFLEKQLNEKEEHLKTNKNQFQLEVSKNLDLVETLNEKIKSLENASVKNETSSSQLSREVVEQKEIIRKLESEVRKRIDELQHLQNKIEERNQEVSSRMKQIKELKNGNESLHQRLTETEKELKSALNQIKIMNEESKEMENCSKSVTIDYEIQIQTLQRGLEELNNERAAERMVIDKLKRSHELELMECVSKIKKDWESDIEKISKKREKEISLRDKEHQDEIQKHKDEFQCLIDDERSKASKIIQKLKTDVDQIKTDLNSRIKTKEKEIANLEESLAGKDREIKSLNIQIKDLKENNTGMKKENHKLTKSNSDKDTEIENSKKNVEKLKLLLEEQKGLNEKIRKNSLIQEDMSEKYNKLSAELDLKWADTLRRETGRLRNDLTESFANEKRKMIEKLEKSKNIEIETIKNQFEIEKSNLLNELSKNESEVNVLQEEIFHLKEANNSQTTTKIQEIQSLLSETQSVHVKEISDLKSSYNISLENLRKKFSQEKEEYESHVRSVMETNEKNWIEKHKTAINSLSLEWEKKMRIKLDEVENKHNRQIDDQVREVRSQMSDKTKLIEDEHKEETKLLHKRILTLEEQIKSLENDRRMEMERLSSAKLKLEIASQRLEGQLQDNVKENQFLKKQIEDFGNDYNRNQKEFSDRLRNQESEMKRGFDQAMQNMKAKYEDDAKQSLTDFNKAQTLYKEKIRDLNKKLLELEEQFVNRPSRDEDIEIIQTLRAQIKVSEKEIEKLNEEKRFFQLELVNRETNFNKLFNASPNVGPMNPSQGPIKTKKMSNEKIKSFQKLTPLPGSPLHDDPINPTKPLPPSSRKSIDNS